MTVTSITAQRLRTRLSELREDYAFWEGQPGQKSYTLAGLQEQIDAVEAQLKALENEAPMTG